jgi:hypothetical protein
MNFNRLRSIICGKENPVHIEEVVVERRRNASMDSDLPQNKCGTLIENKEVFESLRSSINTEKDIS